MTAGRAPRAKTLVVGPIGARPWVTAEELIADLRAIGHDVVVNAGRSDLVVPYPEPLPPRVGTFVNIAPRLVWWLVGMLWRWRRQVRAALAGGAFTHVLVWDPALAALYRFARPAGVELIWVLPAPEGDRLYQRVMRLITARAVDRVVITNAGDRRLAGRRATLVPPSTVVERAPLLDAWVVLGSDRPPSPASLAALAARAARQPAAAMLFDARDHDRLTPDAVEAVRVAAGAARVWWVGDNEWVSWLGGVPREAVDPSHGLVPDHRHTGVLNRGATLLAPATTPAGPWTGLLERQDGDREDWAQFAFRAGIGAGVADRAWAAAAFAAPHEARAALISSQAVPVSSCPMCTGIGRRILCETDGATFVVRCPRCQLHRASHVLPATDGVGDVLAAGTDQAGDEDRRRHVLSELGIGATRLLDLTRAADSAGGRFDVVVLGERLLRSADPVGSLRDIHDRLLEPGGHVLVDVPNIKSLARRRERSAWAGWKPGEYHTYPDDWALRQMLYRSGFRTRLVRSTSESLGAEPRHRITRATTELLDRLGYGDQLIAVGQAQ